VDLEEEKIINTLAAKAINLPNKKNK